MLVLNKSPNGFLFLLWVWDFIKDIDTVILDNKTYKQIISELSLGIWVYDDLKTYVLTHEKHQNTSNIKFVNMNIKELIEMLQNEEGKNIWICGGAILLNQYVKDNLIDEYRITTVPVMLGNGIRLFNEDNQMIKLTLKNTKEENGLITATYVIENY